jgi:hypothetical protein
MGVFSVIESLKQDCLMKSSLIHPLELLTLEILLENSASQKKPCRSRNDIAITDQQTDTDAGLPYEWPPTQRKQKYGGIQEESISNLNLSLSG